MPRIFRLSNFSFLIFAFLLACSPRTPRPEQPRVVVPLAPSDSATQAEELRNYASQCYESEEYDSALDLFTRATQLDPDDPQGWHGRGATLSKMLRHDEAQDALDIAIDLKPDYLVAIWHRACDHSVNLQKEAALSDLRRAVALDPSVKESAKQDRSFQWLWADSEFLSIVK